MAGTIISISGGDGRSPLLDRLGEMLAGRGARVEVVHGSSATGLSGEEARPACRILAKHDVTVVTSICGFSVSEGVNVIDTDLEEIANETRLDAFLRRLELSGLIPPPVEHIDKSEEEAIRERLRELGYL